MTQLDPGTIGRLEAIIQIREKCIDKFESVILGLPEDHWKHPMYESLMDAYTESICAIDEVLRALGWDWESDPEGNVKLIERSEEE